MIVSSNVASEEFVRRILMACLLTNPFQLLVGDKRSNVCTGRFPFV